MSSGYPGTQVSVADSPDSLKEDNITVFVLFSSFEFNGVCIDKGADEQSSAEFTMFCTLGSGILSRCGKTRSSAYPAMNSLSRRSKPCWLTRWYLALLSKYYTYTCSSSQKLSRVHFHTAKKACLYLHMGPYCATRCSNVRCKSWEAASPPAPPINWLISQFLDSGRAIENF